MGREDMGYGLKIWDTSSYDRLWSASQSTDEAGSPSGWGCVEGTGAEYLGTKVGGRDGRGKAGGMLPGPGGREGGAIECPKRSF